MITRGHITQLAAKNGVEAQVIERDYMLTHIIGAIAATSGEDRFIFKGETALRLLHFAEYRYSADMDFSLVDGLTREDALAIVDVALDDAKNQVGIETLYVKSDGQFVMYKGPLGRERRLKLDLSDDELVEESDSFKMLLRYEDQRLPEVRAYSLNEIAAEKLRCVLQRLQARDLFDLHMLFVDQRIDPMVIWDTFEKKTRHKKLDPSLFFERFDQRIPGWKKRWDDEMHEHVPDGQAPPFDEVERDVRKALREMN